MCGTADSLMLTQYVWYSRQINADTHNMCGTADSLMLTHPICSNANDSVHNESATIQFSSAIYCFCVLTQLHRTEGIANTGNKLSQTDRQTDRQTAG